MTELVTFSMVFVVVPKPPTPEQIDALRSVLEHRALVPLSLESFERLEDKIPCGWRYERSELAAVGIRNLLWDRWMQVAYEKEQFCKPPKPMSSEDLEVYGYGQFEDSI
jgi:hypothetical protein